MGNLTRDGWKKYYAALKAVDPNAYYKAIQYGEGVSLTHNLDYKVAADIEVALVMQACELLDIQP